MNIVDYLYIPDEVFVAFKELRSDPSQDPATKFDQLTFSPESINQIRIIGVACAAISLCSFATSYVLAAESANQFHSISMNNLFRRTVCGLNLGLCSVIPFAIGWISGFFSIVALKAKVHDEEVMYPIGAPHLETNSTEQGTKRVETPPLKSILEGISSEEMEAPVYEPIR